MPQKTCLDCGRRVYKGRRRELLPGVFSCITCFQELGPLTDREALVVDDEQDAAAALVQMAQPQELGGDAVESMTAPR
ncbi:hypothetical protein SPRG_21330 [Saprolegnia parasitica CBS 223.65]|uniref:Uncharacterized protein n=1 Tax=Saprolegnia parasitica (strain CBS 223.65) TaxID=695850 RepID=A0A067C3W1_SAPPC|nr:hypothetical protein SPRG_21330 [Saprolegnia parasitica CBS 223.65]KDO21216.1 hypothetical protein SPRG_21330 [Saprolegnia parasitica CBS 223.65]|eukprot:XP_012208079.1 hypothetical protein SPRG_21330 [Saprolegnia parasitica CBS 223.65]